jgi:hypothetical protein
MAKQAARAKTGTKATPKSYRSLRFQWDKTRRIRGEAERWMINGYSRVRLMITAIAL